LEKAKTNIEKTKFTITPSNNRMAPKFFQLVVRNLFGVTIDETKEVHDENPFLVLPKFPITGN